MIASFYYALTNWKLTLLFYLLAFGGDVVDGYVARAFKQSKFYYYFYLFIYLFLSFFSIIKNYNYNKRF